MFRMLQLLHCGVSSFKACSIQDLPATPAGIPGRIRGSLNTALSYRREKGSHFCRVFPSARLYLAADIHSVRMKALNGSRHIFRCQSPCQNPLMPSGKEGPVVFRRLFLQKSVQQIPVEPLSSRTQGAELAAAAARSSGPPIRKALITGSPVSAVILRIKVSSSLP